MPQKSWQSQAEPTFVTARPQCEAIWAFPRMMEKIIMTEQTEPSAEPKPVRPAVQEPLPKEIGGVKGPEPTRYGDWEHKGRCADF